MWVIAAGMQRSGSTVQYQIAKHVIEGSGSGRAVGWFPPEKHGDLEKIYKDDGQIYLVKCHVMTDFLKDKIKHDNAKVIYTHRNILDVISSLKAKNKIEFTEDELRELVVRLKKTYLEWMQCKDIFIQKYDSIRNHLDICVKEIAADLGIDISQERVEEIANTLAFDKQKKFLDQIRDSDTLISINENNTYDPDSLLHVNHIDDGGIGRYKKNLSQHEITLIETVWGAGDAGVRV